MIASKMIRGRFHSCERFLSYAKIEIILECGRHLEMTVHWDKIRRPIQGEEVLLIDVIDQEKLITQRFRSAQSRLYLNFERSQIDHRGGYVAFINGLDISDEQRDLLSERGYERMIRTPWPDTWLAIAEDEIDFTMMVMNHGQFDLTNFFYARP